MSKKVLFLLLSFIFSSVSFGQTQSVVQLQETARTFIKNGDYSNALLVLNRALQQQPSSLEVQKDLALTYYLSRDINKGLEIIKTVLDREDSDVQSFQIAGNIYKALDDFKETDKMYKRGLKKFPNAGALYSEYGELLLARKDPQAIKTWEKGIEVDPDYSGNYYHAAKFYYYSLDKVWSIIYGEAFINLERLSARTAEMKNILFEGYKKLFTETDLTKINLNNKNEFVQAYLNTMNKQLFLTADGITTETLTIIRTRFILDWFNFNGTKFPYRLFEYQRELLREGVFSAYNQWLFGPLENMNAYQAWTKTNGPENEAFIKYQANKIFKIPGGQYYQTK